MVSLALVVSRPSGGPSRALMAVFECCRSADLCGGSGREDDKMLAKSVCAVRRIAVQSDPGRREGCLEMLTFSQHGSPRVVCPYVTVTRDTPSI